MKNRKVIAIFMLLAFGLVRLPLESRLHKTAQAANFHGTDLNVSLFSKIGQLGFIAALGGYRAVVADALWIHANTIWQQRTDWAAMQLDFDTVTTLQPHWPRFWEESAWHMYANASVAALNNPKEPRLALRLKAQRAYWKQGEDYLLRGLANNPQSTTLWTALGSLYKADRLNEPCKAAEAYAKGAALPDAPVFLHRFAVYELAKCPGHEREAYEKLLALYHKGEDERLPTLLTLLGQLQEKLNVPQSEKVDISRPSP